jgi:hypothetical protein
MYDEHQQESNWEFDLPLFSYIYQKCMFSKTSGVQEHAYNSKMASFVALVHPI